MKKIVFALVCILITGIASGSGNIEISDGKLKVFSPDTVQELQLYCSSDLECFLWWLQGALYLGAGDIYFDEDQNMRWDDANDILYVDVVDANTFDVNDINAVDANFTGLVTIETLNLGNPLAVLYGGTGASSLTDGGILLGSGTNPVTVLGVAANGQIPIGDGATDPVLATITGTANQVVVTNGAGSITLSLPQDINTGSAPTFDDLAVTDLLGCGRITVDDIRINASTIETVSNNLVLKSGTPTIDFDDDTLSNINHVITDAITIDNIVIDVSSIDCNSGDMIITAAGGDISFDDENIRTSANVTCAQVLSGGDLTLDAASHIIMSSPVRPHADNTVDLGVVRGTDYRFKDLYLSGNLSDETNALSIANAKTAYDHSQIAGGDTVHVSTAENTAWDTAYGWGDHSTQNYLDDDVASDVDDGDIDWGSGAGQVDMDDLGDGSTNAAVTLTQETNWDTHLTSDGSDHTFVDQNVCVAGMPQLANLGIGTNAAATYGIRASKTIDSVTAFGLDMILYDERDGLCNFMKGLNFAATFRPKATQSADRNANDVYGAMGYAGIASLGTHDHNVTATEAHAFHGKISADRVVGHTGDVILTDGYTFIADTATVTNSAAITNAHAFYDKGQTVGTTSNWGICINTADNYINGDLRIGDTTAPTETLEVNGTVALAGKSELTITAGGAITTTKSYHTVDTENDDATDDLDTITAGSDGEIVVLRPVHDARTVVVKNAADNIVCGKTGGDVTLDDETDTFMAIYDSALSKWLEL